MKTKTQHKIIYNSIKLKLKESKSCLFLDLGTLTGYSIVKNKKLIAYGYRNTFMKNDEDRKIKFRNKISQLVYQYKITTIVYENANFQSTVRFKELFNIYKDVLLEISKSVPLKLHYLSIQDIKKSMTGNSKATKLQVMRAILIKLSLDIDNDDAADAVAMAYTVYGQSIIER